MSVCSLQSNSNRTTPTGHAGESRSDAARLWQHIFGNRADRFQIISVKWDQRKQEWDRKTQIVAYFDYPGQVDEAAKWAERNAVGRNVYHSAHLLLDDRRIKENASAMLTIYAEIDGGDLAGSPIKPTAVVESSPGKYHVYARLRRAIRPEIAEQLNQRWALAFGADASGADQTQVLRTPGSHNFKYATSPEVRLLEIDNQTVYDPADLDRILPKLPAPERQTSTRGEGGAASGPTNLEDAAVLELIFRSKHGDKARREADGDPADHPDENGRPDRNRSDQAFCNRLAWATGKNAEQMDRIVRTLPMMRDKWDEKHFSDGSTYGEHTIQKAIDGCSSTYDPKHGALTGSLLGWPEHQAPAAPTNGNGNGHHAEPAEGCTQACAVCCHQLDELEAKNERLAAELARLRDREAGRQALQKSKAWSGGERQVAEHLLNRAEQARSEGKTTVKMYFPKEAERSGTSVSTVSKFVRRLAAEQERREAAGLPPLPIVPISEHSEDGKTHYQLRIAPESRWGRDASIIGRIARPEELGSHGGARERRCPNHPTANLILKKIWYCDECGRKVDQDETKVRPTPCHDETVPAAAPEPDTVSDFPPVVIGRPFETVSEDAGQPARPPATNGHAPEDDVGFDPPPDGAPPDLLSPLLTIGGALGWPAIVLGGRAYRGRKAWDDLRDTPALLPRALEQARQLAANRDARQP